MSGRPDELSDDDARRTALAVYDRSFLVEAGAGSGKTAVIAGRIALMLSQGFAPKSIAAVTFTELAASELEIRVRDYVSELSAGRTPAELRTALPDGPSPTQRENLVAAIAELDDITCSTIHGFCQKLIKPYPVEADIDPGASVMDRDQADLTFQEITDGWLREKLNGEADGLLAELVLHDPQQAVALIHKICGHMRRNRDIRVVAPASLVPRIEAFCDASADFAAFMRDVEADEPETSLIADQLSKMAETVRTFAPETPADLVRLLLLRPRSDLCVSNGDFRAYKKKGKWKEAAKRAGLAGADGDRLSDAAARHYEACCDSWTVMLQAVAARVLADLINDLHAVVARFRDYKRSAALLDFDDLIFSARDLLRDHDEVRIAIGRRFAQVLVDEFQDTDPLQTEIFWRICGDPPASSDGADWSSFQIRPGALFLVGDPKQAIYRFRGADVAAYMRARDIFRTQDPQNVLSISTNFRSCEPILSYVNERFAPVLAVKNGQPGFTALDAFHGARDGGPCVVALDVKVADEHGKASAERQRDAEAEAVAEMCARLIGAELILDRKTKQHRTIMPGDIALLAPTGSDLWRYEEALERRGIPVATQAGKGFYRRQEVQDLIALTRVLADPRDTVALGALLRGPLVGLTEEELLDIVWQLPRAENSPEALPRLTINTAPEVISHSLARDIIEKLQALRRRLNATTPHVLLAQAVDALRIRPLLLQRHAGQAERALANVDLYLNLSQAYGVRGLRAFAEAMTAAWTDGARAIEGRPDAQEEAVALYTMHSAKGLEWPVVVPINTMTRVLAPENAVMDRFSGQFYCSVFGVAPTGHEAAHAAEASELNRERMRLWYVAATRARELLVLPRLDVEAHSSAWISLLDLSLSGLPSIDVSHLLPEVVSTAERTENTQTRESFAREADGIAEAERHLSWLAPSRDENISTPALQTETPEILTADSDNAMEEGLNLICVQGGRERGLVLHKLIEEVLTGETVEAVADLSARAEILIRELGQAVSTDPAQGLVPAELANCVINVLRLPEIAALRPGLLPEFPVYATRSSEEREEVIYGVADAIAFATDGRAQAIVDWKSDVTPTAETLEHYRAQVSAYLETTGAAYGLIVMMTSGKVISVKPLPPSGS